MVRTFLVVLWLLVGVISLSAADAPQSSEDGPFASVTSSLRVGETVAVHLMSGEELVGPFSSGTAASLTIVVGGQPREFRAADIQRVVTRRVRHHARRGLLIGAPIGVLMASTCSDAVLSPTSTPPSCTGPRIGAMAFGAGMGALIGWRMQTPAVAYVASDRTADVAARAPVESLRDIPARVLPFETVYVRRVGRLGTSVTGRFVAASDSGVTVEREGHPEHIPASEILEVRRRGGTTVLRGMGIGLVTGIALGASVGLTSNTTEEWTRRENVGAGVFVGAFGGLLYGALVGAIVHARPVVYRRAAGPPAPTSSAPQQPAVLLSMGR